MKVIVSNQWYRRVGAGCLLLSTLLLSGCVRSRPVTANTLRAERPALDVATSITLAQRPDFDNVVRLAAERNAGAAVRRLEWYAALQRYPQALTPEDPRVRDLTYDFTEKQWTSVIVEQAVPWPHKLWARGRSAMADAEIARLRYEAAVRDAIIEAKDAYYELYYLDAAWTITERVAGLVRNEALLAYGEMNTGRAQLGEGFRAESQAAQLEYDLQLLAEQRAATAERLRAVLNLPTGTAIGPIEEAPTYTVSDKVDSLDIRAEQFGEALKTRGLEAQRAQYETYLSRWQRLPELMPGALLSGLSGPTQSWMGMLSLSVPLWEWRNRAMVHEREAMEAAARQMALEELNQQRRAVAAAWFAARANARMVTLYRETLLPQAETALRQAETLFKNDQASFSNVLETTLAWHNFQLAYHRARADYGQALGRLEQVIGTTAEPDEAVSKPVGGEE